MLDRLGVVLLPEVVAAEVEMRTLVVGVRRCELIEILLLLPRVVVGSRFGGQNEQSFAGRRSARQADRLAEVLKELLARCRDAGPVQFRESELRIQRNRLVVMFDGFGQQQPFGHITRRQKFLPRLLGRCGDGNLGVLWRRRSLAPRFLALRACRRGDSGSEYQCGQKGELSTRHRASSERVLEMNA